MNEWWGDLDEDILGCLAANGAMTPAEIGRKLGISERAASSFLSLLAGQGKVRICAADVAQKRSA